MNRQTGVEHTKNVIAFDPLLMGHVVRRMRSGRVRILYGKQWKTLYHIKSRTDRHGVFYFGSKVGHVTRHALQLLKVKRSKVKVTMSPNVSAEKKRYNSAVYGHINFKLGGNYRRGGRHGWYTF